MAVIVMNNMSDIKVNLAVADIKVNLVNKYGSQGNMFKPNLGQGDKGDTYCYIQKKTVRKSHILIELVGTLDEAETSLGLAISTLPGELSDIKEILLWVQELLFRIGFSLGGQCCVTEEDIKILESHLSNYTRDTAPKGFIVHAYHPSASAISLARAIIRRLERVFVRALDAGYLVEFEETLLPVINRIGDLLYLLEFYVIKYLGQEPIYATCKR